MSERARRSEEDGYEALRGHVVEKARLARQRHGPRIDGAALLRLLADRDIVRFPTELCFDAAGLRPGEFAHAQRLGEGPQDGYRLDVHPLFRDREDELALLVAYHLPSINYPGVATEVEAELFGATLHGLTVDDYYRRLCELADRIGPPPS